MRIIGNLSMTPLWKKEKTERKDDYMNKICYKLCSTLNLYTAFATDSYDN